VQKLPLHREKARGLDIVRDLYEWEVQTTGREREIYLGEVEPVLREGMDFLRDHGGDIGCFANRYMYHLNDAFEALEKTFGMSWWYSLEHMERWSESHPTHLQIFGRFMKMVQAMIFDLKLRLYHEVSVVAAQDQSFENINCHPRTGLLRCANAG
jgi:aldoxime dehydratase